MPTLTIMAENQHMINIVWQRSGEQSESPPDKLQNVIGDDARKTLIDLTSLIFQLTCEIQCHFAKVSLSVGQDMPPNLMLLWRP